MLPNRPSALAFLAAFVLVWISASPQVRAGELRAGISVAEITPITDLAAYRMSGYFNERINTGTKDPLQAKAIVFEQDGAKAALVFCDLVGIPLEVSELARKLIERETGIPAANVAILATHSHTGPLYFGALRKHFHELAVREHGRDPYEILDYGQELVGRLLRVAQEAANALEVVELAAGYAHEDRLSFNRRFHMRNGTVQFNPGQQNPNIVRAAGPIDPEVGIVRLTASGSDVPLAALVCFALHLDTVGGTEYSADYPKPLEDGLRAKFGEKFISLFGSGTCGDINHVDVRIKGRRSTEEIGGLLAETVAARIPELPRVEAPSLAVRGARVDAALQKYSPEEVAAAREKMAHVADPQVPFLERVHAYKIMALELRGGDTIPLEVQAVRLSDDVAIVTLPGEVFVELGMAIKSESPFATTLVFELANDAPGYIPTRKAFAEGSYETVNSRVVPGSGEQMVEAVVRVLEELAEGLAGGH